MMTPLLVIVKQILKANQSLKFLDKVCGDEYWTTSGYTTNTNAAMLIQFDELANVYKEKLCLVCDSDPNMIVNIVKFVKTKHQIKKWPKEEFNYSWKPFLPKSVNKMLLE